MNRILPFLSLAGVAIIKAAGAMDDSWKNAANIYQFTADDIDGNPIHLANYKGHVCIIVNVATKWGATDRNYRELVELHEKYGEEKGLKILAFPCNQFGNQEPGTNEEIKKFAQGKYGVKFDLFSKIDVNGDTAHPLWKYLKMKQAGFLVNAIKWNFTKFVIDKKGQPVQRYATTTNPLAMEKDLLKYFAEAGDPSSSPSPATPTDSTGPVQ